MLKASFHATEAMSTMKRLPSPYPLSALQVEQNEPRVRAFLRKDLKGEGSTAENTWTNSPRKCPAIKNSCGRSWATRKVLGMSQTQRCCFLFSLSYFVRVRGFTWAWGEVSMDCFMRSAADAITAWQLRHSKGESP